MKTLLCTAPNSSVTSPVESTTSAFWSISARATSSTPPAPSSPGAGSTSSPTSSKGYGIPLLSNPTRRPSIRKRIQSLSRASGVSLDKATATLSSAAGSSFSFLRHSSSSGSRTNSGADAGSSPSSSSTGSVPAPTPTSAASHVRGVSTSSFASGKSNKSSKSTSSSTGLGRSRLNVLNIGPPRGFKHQFHLGPDSRTSDGTWDENRWRHLVQTQTSDAPVIDVVSSSIPGLPRTISEHSLVLVSHPSDSAVAAVSSPNLLSITTSASDPYSSPPPASSPSAFEGTNASPASAKEGATEEDGEKTKTTKAAKRASLVKRKPVPPLYPEEASPLPTTPAATSPTPAAFMLMPDPVPTSSSPKNVEVASTAKVSSDIKESETGKDVCRTSSELVHEKEDDKSEMTETENANTEMKPTDTVQDVAPAHICIMHKNSPPPVPPPRRHTLAHMQARALGRGGGIRTPPRPAEAATNCAPASEPKPKARPVPIIAPSPGFVPIDSPTEEPSATSFEEVQAMEKKAESATNPTPMDNSPRPSLSSLDSSVSSSSGSTGESGARSASTSSSSGSESGETETEPRTPTDERRVSGGLAHSISIQTKTQLWDGNADGDSAGAKNVTIVLPRTSCAYESDADEDHDGEEGEVTTPTRPRARRVSKRPNPPARRVETNEESVYVTADEATDIE